MALGLYCLGFMVNQKDFDIESSFSCSVAARSGFGMGSR